MKRVLVFTAVLFSAAAPLQIAEARTADEIYTAWRNNDAVGGYDVVSFFSGKPRIGQNKYSTEFNGADWKFSSQANLDLFNTNPEAFIPQYGGYCAWAAAKGKLAKGSPKFWRIRDGRLYLKFNGRIQKQWDRDVSGFISKANRNFPNLLADK